MVPLVVVVTSPTCANSALLLTELTLISSIDSAEGNISVSKPFERTLMVEMPSTEAVAINGIDPLKEKNAIKEARALGITTVSLIDTDCDPDLIDLPIPGNDDGIRAIEVVSRHLADAVLAGSATIVTKQKGEGAPMSAGAKMAEMAGKTEA